MQNSKVDEGEDAEGVREKEDDDDNYHGFVGPASPGRKKGKGREKGKCQ